MSDSQKYIKNSIFNSGSKVAQNTPSQYNSEQRQYLSDRTKKFISERAKIASDLVKADIQGLATYFYDYTTLPIRLSDLINPSVNFNKRTDDYKEVLIPDESIDYIPIGAKIKTMGSVWLVVNPSNIVSVSANTVVARCNATYNSYDYYGNVIVEPIVVEKVSMLGNDNESPINMVLMDGYFNIICQLNENTEKLGQNKRIILGDNAYHITGFTNFIEEFTDKEYTEYSDEQVKFIANAETGELGVIYPENYDGATYKIIGANLYEKNSDGLVFVVGNTAYGKAKDNYLTRLITFTVRIDETNENDDLNKRIADGKSYQVSAVLNGQTEIIAGQSTILKPSFLINGEVAESSLTYPLTWNFTSSDESIAKVSADGTVISYTEGTAVITATLQENPNVSAQLEIVITEQTTEPFIAFQGVVNKSVNQFTEETFSALYFENNYPTNYPLNWSFSGAKKTDYNATVSDDGKSVVIECVSPCETPLTITAEYNGYSASIQVNLLGY